MTCRRRACRVHSGSSRLVGRETEGGSERGRKGRERLMKGVYTEIPFGITFGKCKGVDDASFIPSGSTVVQSRTPVSPHKHARTRTTQSRVSRAGGQGRVAASKRDLQGSEVSHDLVHLLHRTAVIAVSIAQPRKNSQKSAPWYI